MATKNKASEKSQFGQIQVNEQIENKNEKIECIVTKVYGDTVVFSLNGTNVQANVKGCSVGSVIVVVVERNKYAYKIISVKRR